MTDTDKRLSDRDIQATNVLPAFEASLCFGATEEELEREIGWRRHELEEMDATVDGASTYRHMELMFRKSRYEAFVLSAAQSHSLSSLGIVGLACKAVKTVSEALTLHHRYQALTNRTATYTTAVHDGVLLISEQRPATCQGSQLISEYTMYVALHLLRTLTGTAPRVLYMNTRRVKHSAIEKEAYQDFLGASITYGSEHAQLALDASILQAGVHSADQELERYFLHVLQQAMPPEPIEPELVRQVRETIQKELLHGTPTAKHIAKILGLGHRTLQRRLSQCELTFAQLLDATRQRLVEGYLRKPELSLTEIAYLLGYSEQASFFRAFRRWFGVTPSHYRQAQPN